MSAEPLLGIRRLRLRDEAVSQVETAIQNGRSSATPRGVQLIDRHEVPVEKVTQLIGARDEQDRERGVERRGTPSEVLRDRIEFRVLQARAAAHPPPTGPGRRASFDEAQTTRARSPSR